MMPPDDDRDSAQRGIDRIQWSFEVIDSPSQRLLEEQRRITEIVAGPISDLQQMMASFVQSESLAAFRQMMEARETFLAQTRLQEVAREMEQAHRTWATAFDGIRRQIEEVTQIADEVRWAGRMSAEVASLAAVSAENLRLMELAGTTLHDRLVMFDTAESPEERYDLLPMLLRALIGWIDALPPSAIAMPMVRRLVSVLVVVVTLSGPISGRMLRKAMDGWRAEDAAHHEKVEGLLGDLAAKVDALAPASEEAPILRTTAPLPLRVAPNGKARRVGTVPSGVLVEQVAHLGRWLSVVYLDLHSGIPVTGWVYKRGLVPEVPTPENESR